MTTVNQWRAAYATYAAALLTVTACAVSGCSDGAGTPSVDGSRAASAASSLAARGGEALASATAAAASELARIKGGVDAKADVRLGSVTVAQGKGKADVPVTAANNGAKPATYTVQVSFRDAGGNLLDAVVVTVPDVPAHGTGRATARSHRDLTGTVKATVDTALRH